MNLYTTTLPKHILFKFLFVFVVAFIFYLLSSFFIKSEALAARDYLMSIGGVQATTDMTDPFNKLTVPLSTLASDADVINLHMEMYGIPWDDFATSPTPPPSHPWTILMNNFASQAQATGKDIYLALHLSRDRLAQNAVNNSGTLKVQDYGSPCYDFTGHTTLGSDANIKKTAYINYLTWMETTFNAKYVTHAIELNEYWENCTNKGQPVAAWNAIVEVANEGLAAVKTIRADAVVFPTVVANELYGYEALAAQCVKPMSNSQCQTIVTNHYNNAYAALANLQRDKFGLSAYPFTAQKYSSSASTPTGRSYWTVSDIPTDYFVRGGDRGGERTIISETGWNTNNLVYKPSSSASCKTLIASTTAIQNSYITTLFSRAQTGAVDMIAWWNNYDLIPSTTMTTCYPFAPPPTYSACGSNIWCIDVNLFRYAFAPNHWLGEVIFKTYGTMGIRSYTGAAKNTVYNTWKNKLAEAYTP